MHFLPITAEMHIQTSTCNAIFTQAQAKYLHHTCIYIHIRLACMHTEHDTLKPLIIKIARCLKNYSKKNGREQTYIIPCFVLLYLAYYFLLKFTINYYFAAINIWTVIYSLPTHIQHIRKPKIHNSIFWHWPRTEKEQLQMGIRQNWSQQNNID